MQLEFHPQAEQEFLEAVSRYEREVPGLGEQMEAEIQAATNLLLQYPEIGSPVEADLRKLVLQRFPYYLIYGVLRDMVYIFALAHERRKPAYWHKRSR
jgi:toxin ParE1/3/4